MNWVAVRWRNPEAEKAVLATDGKDICISMFRSYNDWEHKDCDYGCPRKGDVTHWMYLPDLPVTERVNND